MSETKEHPRPPQTTLIGWVILVGSVYVALQSIESLGQLRTLAMQEVVADILDRMGNPEGVTLADGLAAVRVTTVVAAVCSAACAVLGWFVLRRHAGARIALSVLAVPLLLSTAFTGGFIAMMVIAAIVLLWLQPSRNWFDGLPPIEATPLSQQPPLSRRARRDADADSAREAEWDALHTPPSASQPSDAPVVQAPTGDTGARPVQGFGTAVPNASYGDGSGAAPGVAPVPAPGTPPAHPAQSYGAGAPQTVPAGYGAPAGSRRPPRPRALVVATVISFLFAGVGLLSSLATLAVAAVGGEKLMQELLDQQPMLADQGIEASELGSLLMFTGGVLAFLCLLGLAAAGLALAGNAVGRVMLMLIAGFVFAFTIVGIATNPVMIFPGIAALITVLQLARRDVAEWFRVVNAR